jgi:hypothetical protein
MSACFDEHWPSGQNCSRTPRGSLLFLSIGGAGRMTRHPDRMQSGG